MSGSQSSAKAQSVVDDEQLSTVSLASPKPEELGAVGNGDPKEIPILCDSTTCEVGDVTSDNGGISDGERQETVSTTAETNGVATEPTTPDIKIESDDDLDMKDLVQSSAKFADVVSYHAEADTYIRIRDAEGNGLYYKVCSALVAAASPTLKTIIHGPAASVSRNGKLVFDVADFGNDSFGLDLVLSIIHYKFKEIPSRPDVDQLYGLAKVVEKCDCAHLLAGYMEKWVSGLNWHIVMQNEQNDHDKTLYLTWVLGEARWFARMLSRVAQNATLSDAGELLDTRGLPWKDQGLPESVIELIRKARIDCLTKCVKAVDQPLHDLIAGGDAAMKFCRSKDANDELKQSCHHLQLGSLMSSLAAAKLVPFPTINGYRGSASALAKKLGAMKVIRFKLPGTPAHLDSHINCGIHHQEALEDALSQEVELPVWVIQQLALRAQKSGAWSEEVFKGFNAEEAIQNASDPALENLLLDSTQFKQVKVMDYVLADMELGAEPGRAEGSIKEEKVEAEDTGA